MTIDELLPRLESVRRYRGGWKARCPGHEDRDPSLSIIEGVNGRAVVYCHGGCEYKDIVAALGFSCQPDHKPDRPKYVRVSAAKKDDRRWATLPDAMRDCAPPGFKLAVWYFYTPRFARARYEKPSGDKTFRPFHEPEPGCWALGDPPHPLPLFQVAQILKRPAETIHYCEGEKVACWLRDNFGYLTTTGGCSSSDSKTDFTPLAGRDVVIWPDNDTSGIAHAHRVATKVRGLGGTVQIAKIPKGAALRSDAVDWLGIPPRNALSLEAIREIFLGAKLL